MISLKFPKTPEFISAAITYLKGQLPAGNYILGCGHGPDNPAPEDFNYPDDTLDCVLHASPAEGTGDAYYTPVTEGLESGGLPPTQALR